MSWIGLCRYLMGSWIQVYLKNCAFCLCVLQLHWLKNERKEKLRRLRILYLVAFLEKWLIKNKKCRMVFFLTRHIQKRLPLHLSASQMMSSALQFRTGKYRVLQGNPYNENRIPLMKRFFLWELTYREFPVSLTGFGFAVRALSTAFISFVFAATLSMIRISGCVN